MTTEELLAQVRGTKSGETMTVNIPVKIHLSETASIRLYVSRQASSPEEALDRIGELVSQGWEIDVWEKKPKFSQRQWGQRDYNRRY